MLCVLQYIEIKRNIHAKLNTKTMAKERTMNELRQEKTYGYKAPFGMTHQKEPEIREGEIDLGYTEIDIETTKELIISNLKKHFYDLIFQEVCEHMSRHEVFQEETYFTPQGMDEFEDQWFEFYHEHHGDILGAILKHITN